MVMNCQGNVASRVLVKDKRCRAETKGECEVYIKLTPPYHS